MVGDVELHNAFAQFLQPRALGAHLHAGLVGVQQQPFDRIGERLGVVRLVENSAAGRLDHLRERGVTRLDHWRPRRQRFDDEQAYRFPITRRH